MKVTNTFTLYEFNRKDRHVYAKFAMFNLYIKALCAHCENLCALCV